MATRLYLLGGNDVSEREITTNFPTKLTNKAGASVYFEAKAISTSAGTWKYTTLTTSVAGPTSGIEAGFSISDGHWVSPPLAAAVDITGTITFNVWAREDSMLANATIACMVQKVAAQTLALTDIVTGSSFGTELTTTISANQWTADATDVSLAKGDRIRIVLYFDDATGLTMASGHSLVSNAGSDVANSADSWVEFTETISFMTFSGATQVFPTDTASDLATADVDYKAWTTRGT